MNSAHCGDANRCSNGSQCGGDGSIDSGCIDLQNRASPSADEVTSALQHVQQLLPKNEHMIATCAEVQAAAGADENIPQALCLEPQ